MRTGTEDWYVHAACRETSRDVFFSEDDAHVRAALALCASCPVRELCLDLAIARRERHGVWGGTTEAERRRIFRAAGRGRRPVAA